MTDIKGQRSAKTAVAAADYSSVDPAPITVAKGAGDGLIITVTPSALSGAGCTITVTVKDADTNKTIGSPIVVSSTTPSVTHFNLPKDVHRVTVTPVGSGTRTTLNYTIGVVWKNLTYAPGVYHDGTAWVSSEAVNP